MIDKFFDIIKHMTAGSLLFAIAVLYSQNAIKRSMNVLEIVGIAAIFLATALAFYKLENKD